MNFKVLATVAIAGTLGLAPAAMAQQVAGSTAFRLDNSGTVRAVTAAAAIGSDNAFADATVVGNDLTSRALGSGSFIINLFGADGFLAGGPSPGSTIPFEDIDLLSVEDGEVSVADTDLDTTP